MDARTRSTLIGNHFPIIAGDVPAEHDHFVGRLMEEGATLRQSSQEAARYAESLLAENQVLRNMRTEAEKYALSLEAERDRLLNKVS